MKRTHLFSAISALVMAAGTLSLSSVMAFRGGQSTPSKPIPIAPSQLLGKTFEQCEKILGKPALIGKSKVSPRSLIRYYKSPVAGVTRVILSRVPEGSMDGPVPSTVNMIRYQFPKGEKTPTEALAMLGFSEEQVKNSNPENPRSTSFLVEDKYNADRETAEQSLKRSKVFQHPNDDELRVIGKGK